MLKPLKEDKLAKNGNRCLKRCQGGAKIPEVKQLLTTFVKENSEPIHKVIITVGANDTRRLEKVEDVNALQPSLEDLLSTARKSYPEAEIFVTSLLPRKMTLEEGKREENKLRVDKFYEYNRLLFNICKEQGYKYVDAATAFFRPKRGGKGRSLNMRLFKKDPTDEVHLSPIGTSVFARRFIYVINKHNNPNPTVY